MKEIVFQGGINRDVTPRFIGDDYTNAKNIIFQTGKDGKGGLMRLYPGFLRVGSQENLGQTYGTIEDKANSKLYYFLVDSIWVYNQLTETRTKIFEWSGLGATKKHGGIIGEFLYWTDGINPPRYINVTRNYQNVIDYDISLIRPAGLFPLQTTQVSSYADFSPLKGFAYQFSYRYVYEDNQASVIAPWTPSVFVGEDIDAIFVRKNTFESIPKYVRVVELLVRRNDEQFWQIFSTVTPQFFLSSQTAFFGDQLGRTISSIESTKPFENIPLTAKTIEIARDRVFLANNKEGYDLLSFPSLRADLLPEDTNLPPEILAVWEHNVLTVINTGLFNDQMEELIIQQTQKNYYVRKDDRFYFLATGDYREIQFFNPSDPTETAFFPGDYTGSETILNANESDFQTLDNLVFFDDIVSGTQIIGTVTQTPSHTVELRIGILSSVGSTKFKNRSQYRIGIVFYDRYLRNAGVYTNDNCIVTINDDFRNGQIDSIRWSINPVESIPDWAECYQIVRTDNLSRVTFIQGRTSDILYAYTENGEIKYSRSYRADAEFVEVDISGSFKAGNSYNFSEGDRIDIETSTGIKTFPIIGFTGARVRIPPVSNPSFTTTGSPFPVRLFYEIYTPRLRSQDLLFYEVGEVHRVINPRQPSRAFSATQGFLRGDVTVVQTTTFDYPDSRTPTSGDLPADDISTVNNISVEARNPVNSTDVGWIKDIARPNAVLDIGQVVKEGAIRYSNRFIQGTRVNGTSSFDFGDEEIVGIENGQINRLALVSKQQREGSVMLAICEQECLSIYLGETQIIDNEGNQVVGSTQRVIGTINVLSGGYGTKHTYSVVKHEGRAWWWDEYAWQVVRYDSNGIRPISELGMRSYFYGRNTEPVTGYDPFHKLFFIKFDETITFDETANKWRSTYEFSPDWFGKINEFLVTFKNGIPYRSNHTTRANYFGNQNIGIFTFKLVFPFPSLLETIGIYMTPDSFDWSNGREILRDVIEISVTNDKGQATNLINTDFDVYENVAYAHFLRNEYSVGGLLTGEVMRDDIFTVTLKIKDDIGIEMIIFNDNKSSGHS